MRTVADIDKELRELEEKLKTEEGRPTEVYSRIVGYYRSLKNWNRGKREEYAHRVVFAPQFERTAPAAAEDTSGPANIEPEPASTEAQPVEYIYFFRQTCPNCPPMKSMLPQIGLPGTEMDVDTDEGVEAALANGIYATPTVVFYDSQHAEVYRVSTVRELSGLKIPQMA